MEYDSIVYGNYRLNKLFDARKTDPFCPNYDLYKVDG